MKKKELHIISHSHWDREWYLSWAKHNYRLIRLIDSLIDVMEKKEAFRYFHLDGQVVLVEDYLAVRPERKERLLKLIGDGRIKIGPFYILQDEFLISGESSIRNVLYGLKECERYGAPVMCGYFPDAFGHISQMPQIMRGFGIDNAFFGRGIMPEGYWSEFAGKSPWGFAEIEWEGADGSRVIGVQFSHWYDNASQLPADEEELKKRMDGILRLTEITSRTPYHLGMNGSDHQPVQTNLPEIIDKLNKREDFTFIHSCLDDYLEKIRPYRGEFDVYEGEITGKNGNGYRTLIGTASSRVYLKQRNFRAQRALTELCEPLSVMASSAGGSYDADILYWCWKKLMKNFPHDSICGCSVDDVHKKIESRYADVIDTAESLLRDTADFLSASVAADESGAKTVVVYNTDPFAADGACEFDAVYTEDQAVPENPALYDEDGREVPCMFSEAKEGKRFILPYDRFREVQSVRTLTLFFRAENVPGLGYKKYFVCERKNACLPCSLRADERGAENAYIRLKFRQDGSFSLEDKQTGRTARRLNYFEEIRDVGNEYEFIADGDRYESNGTAEIRKIREGGGTVTFEIVCRVGPEERSTKVISEITMEENSRLVRIVTRFENVHKNHRIRAAFDTGAETDAVYAGGQFDFTKRDIRPGDRWKNPCNPQRMDGPIVLTERSYGAMVTARGLNEYEVSADKSNVLYLTLMRGVGELGDWFYFPTADSQCLGSCEAEYAVCLFGGEAELASAAVESENYRLQKFVLCEALARGGDKLNKSLFGFEREGAVFTSAVKESEDKTGYIVRLYNPWKENASVRTETPFDVVDMAERGVLEQGIREYCVAPKKIVTLYFKK